MRETLRPAEAVDWPSVSDALSAEGLPVSDLSAASMAHFWVAAAADGRLVGAVAVERYASIGLLRSLVVVPEARGQGVAGRLLGHAERNAQALGAEQLWLLTIDADRYFETQGYVKQTRDVVPAAIAATSEFSDLCPANAVLMKKVL